MRSTCIALCTIQAVTENALDAKWWLPMKRKNIEDTFTNQIAGAMVQNKIQKS